MQNVVISPQQLQDLQLAVYGVCDEFWQMPPSLASDNATDWLVLWKPMSRWASQVISAVSMQSL